MKRGEEEAILEGRKTDRLIEREKKRGRRGGRGNWKKRLTLIKGKKS